MAEHEVITTYAEIEAALERAKLHDSEPRACAVEHIPALKLLIVGLSNERRLVLPVEDLQGLGNATHKQIQNYELLGHGTGISFPELDVDLYVPALIETSTETDDGWRSWAGKAAAPKPRPSAKQPRPTAQKAEGRRESR
jgi:hypothetical protein